MKIRGKSLHEDNSSAFFVEGEDYRPPSAGEAGGDGDNAVEGGAQDGNERRSAMMELFDSKIEARALEHMEKLKEKWAKRAATKDSEDEYEGGTGNYNYFLTDNDKYDLQDLASDDSDEMTFNGHTRGSNRAKALAAGG